MSISGFLIMRYTVFFLLILFCLSACSRETTLENIDSYLQGKWQANNARFQAFGEGSNAAETHKYDKAIISFLPGNEIQLLLSDSSRLSGSYKIQANGRSYYNLHLEVGNDSIEIYKEIWYISGGSGKKWRAEIESKEGWVNFQGVRQ